MARKSQMHSTFECKYCDFLVFNKQKFAEHIKTTEHKTNVNVVQTLAISGIPSPHDIESSEHDKTDVSSKQEDNDQHG